MISMTGTSTDVDADCDGSLTADDCNDYDATSTIMAEDMDCDGIATAVDCDDMDDAIGSTDDDADGYIDCVDDCDPSDASVGPLDADGDGFIACVDDCDDGNDMIYPGAAVNEPTICTMDADGDGYGATSYTASCFDIMMYMIHMAMAGTVTVLMWLLVVVLLTLLNCQPVLLVREVCFSGSADIVWDSGSWISEISMDIVVDGSTLVSLSGSDLSSTFSGGDVVFTGFNFG